MPIPEATVDELVAAIKKSNFINVIVEGRDDIVAYRTLERDINQNNINAVSLISAGGREKILEISRRLQGSPVMGRCIFICDRDAWIFSGVPEEVAEVGIIMTDGYSIENDIARDYPPIEFMDAEEAEKYSSDLNYFSQWFAIEIQAHLSGRDAELSRFPGLILDATPREDLTLAVLPDEPAGKIFETISTDRDKHLRGKSLMQIAMRQLARKGRVTKHHHLTYLEHGAARRGPFFRRIIDEVKLRVVDASKPRI